MNIQQLEKSLQGQFKNHFDPEEIEQLTRNLKFVQRESKLNATTFRPPDLKRMANQQHHHVTS